MEYLLVITSDMLLVRDSGIERLDSVQVIHIPTLNTGIVEHPLHCFYLHFH